MGYELNPFTRKLDKVGGGAGGTTNVTGVITITPGGNTAGATNAISSGSVMFAGGNNITLSQNGSTISIVGGAGGNGIAASLTGNTAGVMANISTGTMYLAGGNNVTLSQNANSVTISGPNTVAQTQFVLSNSNGVSFGTNGSTVTATVRTDYQSAGAYLTTAMQSASSSVFAKTGFTTASTAGTDIVGTHDTNGLSMGIPKYITTAQPVGAYLTTARASNDAVGLNTAQTNVTWTVNSSGISLNAGAYLTTAQPVGAYLTTARASNDAIGLNTALTANGVAWTVNSSGLSLNVPAFLTTAALSNHSHGNPTLALTNLSGTTASASNGLTLSLSAAAPGAGGGAALKGSGTYTQNTGTVEFANSNGITFGLSNNGTMTASHNGLTTARASNDGLGLATAQTNVTWTANSAGLSINAGGYAGTGTTGTNATFTLNSNGLQLNAGAYLTTAMASNRGSDFVQATAAFAGTNASGTIASNGISVSVAAPGAAAENNNMSLLGNVVGNSTASGSTIAFSAGNNVTLSGTNGSVIRIDAGGGGAGATFSYFRHPSNAPFNASSSQSFGVSTMAIQPFQLPFYVSASYIRQPISVGFGSTTFASGANTTHSLRQTNTYYAIVYSQGVGASSRSIHSVYSSSLTDVMQIDARVGAASNNMTVSHFFTHGATGNSSIGFTTGYSPAASSIVRVSTTHLTNFTGARFLDIPFATLLAPGNYWLGIQVSSATAVSGTAAMNANTQKVSYYNMTQVSANVNEYGGLASAGSNMWQGFGHGNWTTNSSGATTASINLAEVSTVANQPVFPFEFRRQA